MITGLSLGCQYCHLYKPRIQKGLKMEHRTIDFAETASIDLMDLNNKVVNMRPVVKRAKAQIVNNLCRHIADLKKKKGTEKQKAQNLRKAERFLEEIESVKRLKDDKISKYSLANSMSAINTSGVTQSIGIRALTRLANHHLMKKTVSEFRDSHSDWKDLVAYLLVNQTGRKFKTKKQKQEKRNKGTENRTVSEAMTKTYVQDRFGEAGLKKAEEKFHQKRKKKTGNVRTEMDHVENETVDKGTRDHIKENIRNTNIVVSDRKNVESEIRKFEFVTEELSRDPVSKHSDLSTKKHHDEKQVVKLKRTQVEQTNENNSSFEDEGSDHVRGSSRTCDKFGEEDGDKNDSDGSSEHSCDELGGSNMKTVTTDVSTIQHKEVNSAPPRLATECVVKKLKIVNDSENSETSDEDSDKDDEPSTSCSDQDNLDDDIHGNSSERTHFGKFSDDSQMNSENNTSAVPFKKPVKTTFKPSGSNGSEDEEVLQKPKSVGRKKLKNTLEFLTDTSNEALKLTQKDSFFDGCESEDDSNSIKLSEENEEEADEFMDFADRDYSYNKIGYKQTNSMFYNPSFGVQTGGRKRKDTSVKGRDWKGQNKTMKWDKVHWERQGRQKETHDGPRKGGQWNKEWMGKQDAADKGWKRKSESGSQYMNTGSFSDRRDTDGTKQKKNTDSRLEISKREAKPERSNTGEKLHPSWEASRKRRAEESQIVAFKGTKIRFDD